jgi:hypothetical protein
VILTAKNQTNGRKTLPDAALLTINPTLTGVGFNPDLGYEKLATNRLSHTTLKWILNT